MTSYYLSFSVPPGLLQIAIRYGSECVRVRQELTIAESQLRDYQARLGKPFAHEDYLAGLTELRDQLKAALSGGNSDLDDDDAPSAFGMARQDQIPQGSKHHRGHAAARTRETLHCRGT